MNFTDTLKKLNFLNAGKGVDAVNYIIGSWRAKQDCCIVHFMYYASLELIRKNETYASSMYIGDYILVDGIGMQTYFRLLMKKEMTNLNGTDLAPLFFDKLVQDKISFSLYGTTAKQIEACYNNLSKQYGDNIIDYYQDGFSTLNWDKIPAATVLFVGLGTPLQENWVKDNLDIIRHKKLLVVTLGGYFDFLSGFYVRAPKWIRKIKMEWAWRTLLHPNRHYKKRLRDTTILFRPFLDKLNGIQNFFRIQEVN